MLTRCFTGSQQGPRKIAFLSHLVEDLRTCFILSGIHRSITADDGLWLTYVRSFPPNTEDHRPRQQAAREPHQGPPQQEDRLCPRPRQGGCWVCFFSFTVHAGGSQAMDWKVVLTDGRTASPPMSAASSNSCATARTSAPASSPRRRSAYSIDGGDILDTS